MPKLVLQLPEGKGTDAGGHIYDQDKHDGLLGAEVHGLLRIDSRQRDHRLHAALIKQDADQEAHQIGVTSDIAHSLPSAGEHARVAAIRQFLRQGPFLKKNESGQRGNREQQRRNQHGNGYELRGSMSLRLRPGHVGQRGSETDQPADIAERPAPARHFPQRTASGQLRQKSGGQVFAGTEEKI